MIKRIAISIIAAMSAMTAFAQGVTEKAVAMTDRECYLAGERLRVSVDVRLDDGTPSPSKVAYVEISDTKQMCAQAMVALENGIGWGEIALSPMMHSGNYQMTVYTRAMRNDGPDTYFKTIIGIVNADRLSRRDDILFLPKEQYEQSQDVETSGAKFRREGKEVVVDIPSEYIGHCSVAVEHTKLLIDNQAAPAEQLEKNSVGDVRLTSELEGHIVTARTVRKIDNKDIKTRLVLVGQTANVYDGQPQSDGSFCYYTNNVYGTQPSLVNGYTPEGEAIQMKLVSPFAVTLPKALPQLTVYCDKQEIVTRSMEARRQHAINEWLNVDSLVHSTGFMNSQPDRFYDLDEYTKFNTINEIIIEFVKGVKRKKTNGINFLYTFDTENHKFSMWPALVLLDGMPVYDIDEILSYDANLVKYVQIYNKRYTFGNSCCQGVISFITHKGRLSNYKLDAGSHLLSYAFPQERSDFENHIGRENGVIYWNPCVESNQIRVEIPENQGEYSIMLQYITPEGEIRKEAMSLVDIDNK